MRAWVDSNVLIWHLRGKPEALRFLRHLARDPEREMWTGAMQRAEVVFFMRANEQETTELFLSQFRTAPIVQETVDLAGRLYRTWNPSHGIGPNDALLAALAMLHGGKIHTLNVKHFPMPDLLVDKAW